uniref:Uncharacterized protein n=1 Tax=Oryza barthii TaxID=65489 RepID=A0A0D3GFB3_9ORYZ
MATFEMLRRRQRTAGRRRRLLLAFGLSKEGGRQLKNYLRMLHVRGIAPKLTRERVIDDDDRRLYLKKKGLISLITMPQFNSFDGLAIGILAKTVAQWLGQQRLESTVTAKWPTAALWTPRTPMSSTQGVRFMQKGEPITGLS